MNIKVFNNLDIEFSKALNTLEYYTSSLINKKSGSSNWNMEVWLDEVQTRKGPLITCGLSLKRPKSSSIFSKKTASCLDKAVKESISVVEQSLRKGD